MRKLALFGISVALVMLAGTAFAKEFKTGGLNGGEEVPARDTNARGNATFSPTVIESKSAAFWNRKPMQRRTVASSRPATAVSGNPPPTALPSASFLTGMSGWDAGASSPRSSACGRRAGAASCARARRPR